MVCPKYSLTHLRIRRRLRRMNSVNAFFCIYCNNKIIHRQNIKWEWKKKWKNLLISVAVSLSVGIMSALLSMGGMRAYADMYKPPLSPSGWVFPIVWTILYVLMGIAAFLVFQSVGEDKKLALTLYVIQLFLNFGWSIIFFDLKAYFFAFAWLLVLWLFIYLTMKQFRQLNKTAGILMLPYLAWVAFAGYLNLAIAIYYSIH